MKGLLALMFLVSAVAGFAGTEKERGSVSVRSYWAREVFDWNNDDLLCDYRIGDTAVMTVLVREGAVMHYGHSGMMS